MRSMLFALVRKELFLVFHPMTLVVLGLSALVLVPNWPYAVILLYACLCPYFNAQSAREQRDLDFAATLPASRRDMAAARVLATALVEAACVVLMLAFSLARPLAGAPDAFVAHANAQEQADDALLTSRELAAHIRALAQSE